MSVSARRVDIQIIRGNRVLKTWALKEVVDGVESDYDTTGKTFRLRVMDRATPAVEVFNITPETDKGMGYVAFDLQNAQTDFSGQYDYFLEEVLGGSEFITSAYGTFNYVDISKVIPFINLVTNETPPGVTIPESYINAKSLEWRTVLKTYSNSALNAAVVNDEATWPLLYNILIAKLVVHDLMMLGLKSFVVQGSGGAEGNKANVKTIETGPAKVEFHDAIKGMADFLKVSGGKTAVDALKSDICNLASTLGVHLGMCPPVKIPIIPQKQGLDTPLTENELLSKYYS